MKLIVEAYEAQHQRWPQTGRVILAQYDDESVVVYQAYRPEIGLFAAKHGYFGGEFKMSRMTWVKPNFLWMMYRSGWGTKEGQEVTLAVRLRRTAFDDLLASAVPSSFDPNTYQSEADWKQHVATSDVRLQWDPDRSPTGQPLERRAIQLGLRGEAITKYAREWIIEIEDISEFVAEQHHNLKQSEKSSIFMPREDVYPVTDPPAALGM
ncbi:MAG: hypothetical protein JWP89_2539 [Schlesneria sp.]|nr:hypothetical protein [Schlesneria sp.]